MAQTNSLHQNNRNMYEDLDEVNMQLLKDILTRLELNEGNVRMDTVGPRAGRSASADKTPELENMEVNSVRLNINNAMAVSLKDTMTKKSKENEKVRYSRSLAVKGKQIAFAEAVKEKVQQKDLEEHIRLLRTKQQELTDIMEMCKLKEAKAHFRAEKRKQEDGNPEFMERFNSVGVDMTAEICIAKSNNENVKQLKALLEKYERLQKRACTFKEQVLEQHTKNKIYKKKLTKTQQMAEELLKNQTLLEKQKDDAMREVSTCREKMQAMEEEQKQSTRTIKTVEEERSALKAEYQTRSEQLWKTQVENKKLSEAIESIELQRGRAENKLQESQKAVKQLYEELHESKTKTDSIYLQLKAMKKEFRCICNRHKVEMLHLKEQQKACMEQFEGMNTECETLKEYLSKLEKDKCMLIEELEHLQKQRVKSETASKHEGERLREVVGLLERERELLLKEMGDLRKDYFSLSDRITQRLGQLDQTDDPMCITDFSSLPQGNHNR